MDENYLKMIMALPYEFFEGWEWKAGDEVYARNWNMEFLVSFVSPNGVSATKLNSLTPTVTINPDVPINENIRPIPSQEQLQKKCIDFENRDKRYTYSNDFSISKRFIALVIEGDLVKNIEEKTLKEMWLEFTEYLVYDKTWDGDAWI